MSDGWWVAIIIVIIAIIALAGGLGSSNDPSGDFDYDPGFRCGRVYCD